MTDNTFTIDGYTIRHVPLNWVVEVEREVDQSRKNAKNLTRTEILGYYGSVAAALRSIFHEELTSQGASDVASLLRAIQGAESRITRAGDIAEKTTGVLA